MPDHTPFAWKAVLGLVAIALLLAASFAERGAPGPLRARVRAALLAASVLVSLAAFTNLGRFHDIARWPGFAHYWEHFHYQLGSRFFPELGYDGLYAASVEAQRELSPNVEPEARIRDLTDYGWVRTDVDTEVFAAARARFAPARWQAFVRDHAEYQRVLGTGTMAAIRSDHGYNPTPWWTFVARTFTRFVDPTPLGLSALALLDVALLAAAFVAIARTFGAWAACAALAVFGTGYGWRFYYNGGALLRFDWLAASLLGACALARGRSRLAGAAVGYAAMVRLFPALLLVGPAVLALLEAHRSWNAGARTLRDLVPRWARELALGFAAMVAIALVAGSLAGRGPGAWLEFADKIALHRATSSPNKVALAVAARGGPEVVRAIATGVPPDAWPRSAAGVEEVKRARRPLELALAGVVAIAFAAALRRASPIEALCLSAAAVPFALLQLDDYYGVVLVLVALVGTRAPALAVVAFSALLCAAHAMLDPAAIATPSAASFGAASELERLSAAANGVRYAAASTVMWVGVVAWLAARGFRGRRGARDRARARA